MLVSAVKLVLDWGFWKLNGGSEPGGMLNSVTTSCPGGRPGAVETRVPSDGCESWTLKNSVSV